MILSYSSDIYESLEMMNFLVLIVGLVEYWKIE